MQRLTLEERHKVGKLDQMHVQPVRKMMVQGGCSNMKMQATK